MNIENLVKMANDIGNFFNAEPDRSAAVHGIADHIVKFWDPRMRQAIIAHNREGGIGLNELPRAAIAGLGSELASLREAGDG
ncbi:formate dehydrogenase subunit delta [Methylocaldum sp.]|uniref:formate dehydrogenase subunit delta n=1 Tax=Methylocaldum sp. TaxID=1969727 RepID=UPI002D535EA5|nr:formate dehydrogenase subunit delta [Methylocaldum sp.]HYE35360.1 formate dehydrogenase subunit delta [Methylocaldum sp.]